MQGYRRGAAGVAIQNSPVSSPVYATCTGSFGIHRSRQYLRVRNIYSEYYDVVYTIRKLDYAEFQKIPRIFTIVEVTLKWMQLAPCFQRAAWSVSLPSRDSSRTAQK